MKKSVESVVYDLIGVGFGPSNIALAVAIDERSKSQGNLNSLFLDKQSDYSWHGNTLISQSELQISFLKDLVSLRNPTSHYSFVNYLHAQGRLVDFINLGTFYPCRMEFNDYLRWVAGHFSQSSSYGEEVVSIEPIFKQEKVNELRVISRDVLGNQFEKTARSVVLGSGGTPSIPEEFKGLKDDGRVFHHSQYLQRMLTQPCGKGKSMRIAIVGGGQSAAEAFIDLNDSYPSVQVDMIMRASALKPADSSPFVNEIFSPDFTDVIYNLASEDRERLVNEYHNTNYSVVDIELIDRIYSIFYRQKVSDLQRHAFDCLTSVNSAEATDQGVELSLHNMADGTDSTKQYDLVILATGYKRKHYKELLAPMAEYLGDFEVDRDYRIKTDERCDAALYMQGFCQSTHGLSDTLLSVLAIRSDEIAESLYAHLVKQQSGKTFSSSIVDTVE
ncbi:ornithine monooxygenase [Gammaproteobacteria bacterium 42_54_T18]|nr:ornithine monooxygenase [Gammaproteobacteria bacterium 42_54_T18]